MKGVVRSFLCLTMASVLLSCATPNMDLTERGTLSGNLMVWWIGEDNFIYYPYIKDRLRFRLPERLAKSTGVNEISPGVMFTDGGSIPRPLRGVVGLSPWGYGPAYVVHDWLFAAHHCIVTMQEDKLDLRDHAEVELVKKVDFQASANILGSIVATLIADQTVPPHGIAPKAIYTAVDSFVARRLWDSKDPKSCVTVSASQLESIRRQIDREPDLKALQAAPFRAGEPHLILQQKF